MKYKNWPDDTPLPKGAEIFKGWVVPSDVGNFLFSEDQIIDGCFYMTEGIGWDLINHCHIEM